MDAQKVEKVGQVSDEIDALLHEKVYTECSCAMTESSFWSCEMHGPEGIEDQLAAAYNRLRDLNND
jgi:hypothetical protein